ncbi:MAG: hypothetical protein JJ992_18945, partial [Planctomycetes bacterium]|nr:hypothetical protein [Planctomycetota bacterium]
LGGEGDGIVVNGRITEISQLGRRQEQRSEQETQSETTTHNQQPVRMEEDGKGGRAQQKNRALNSLLYPDSHRQREALRGVQKSLTQPV